MNYLELGWDHIVNINAYDHLLFLLLLILPLYEMRIWTLVKLVTAFTIGHALTIIISLGNLPGSLIYMTELLIPLTIVITGVKSFLARNKVENLSVQYYLLVGLFGLIHGLGFAAAIKSMLLVEESVIWPLLQFNMGVEIGQVSVLLIIVILMKWINNEFMKLDKLTYFISLKKLISISGIIAAIWMIIDRV